jgi:lipoate-protein ligase A
MFKIVKDCNRIKKQSFYKRSHSGSSISDYFNQINSGKPRIFLTGETDTRLLLAFGEYLFKSQIPSLFISRAKPAVVIGRHQNPYSECNFRNIDNDGIDVVRRTSGGGAVYVDNGTLMVGFYGPRYYPNFNKNNVNQIIIKSLNPLLKYPAEIVGKNDIKVSIEDKYHKIAGQAYKLDDSHYLHHLSILVDTKMSKLTNYLMPNQSKMQSKAIKSVRSNVVNVIDIVNNDIVNNSNREDLCYDITMKLKDNFMDHYNFGDAHVTIITQDNIRHYLDKLNNVDFGLITGDQLLEIDSIRDSYNRLCSNEWLFGKTPEFTHKFEARFDWGTTRIEFLVKNNIIRNVTCYTDSIYIDIPNKLQNILMENIYDKDSISYQFDNVCYNCDEYHMKQILFDIKNMIINCMA